MDNIHPAELKNARYLSSIITTEDNDRLLMSPTTKEIRGAVFLINKLKAPGPYDLNGQFYQDFWTLFKSEVDAFVCEFFHSNIIAHTAN